jgi:hypothetical protein
MGEVGHHHRRRPHRGVVDHLLLAAMKGLATFMIVMFALASISRPDSIVMGVEEIVRLA